MSPTPPNPDREFRLDQCIPALLHILEDATEGGNEYRCWTDQEFLVLKALARFLSSATEVRIIDETPTNNVHRP